MTHRKHNRKAVKTGVGAHSRAGGPRSGRLEAPDGFASIPADDPDGTRLHRPTRLCRAKRPCRPIAHPARNEAAHPHPDGPLELSYTAISRRPNQTVASAGRPSLPSASAAWAAANRATGTRYGLQLT